MNEPSPLFIIGCPRSGTKLLRELLNNHPSISLGGEGYYIPPLIEHFGVGADLSQPGLWRKIYKAFSRTSFYQKGTSYRQQISTREVLTEDVFVDKLNTRFIENDALTWSDVFEVILRAYSPRPDAQVWGDKSHGYISHVPLLRKIFPSVRLIFIIRDPRDQALSVQRTWGRNPLRAAQGWYGTVREAERFGLEGSPDALIVRYEDLTEKPNVELARVCAFLELPFTEVMAKLQQPAESKKRHNQLLENVTKQHAKYRNALSAVMVRRISEVTFPYLAKYGYDHEGADRHLPLSKLQLQKMSYLDGLASLRHHVEKHGVINGLRYYSSKRYEARARRMRRSKHSA